MRNFTFLTMLLVVLALGVNAQTTYSDDFSAAHDYLTDGVTGTIWDGLVVNDNVWESTSTAVITELNTNSTAGVLTFSDSLSYWGVGGDNGAMLYRKVAADVDFSVQVKIAGGDFPSFGADEVYYLMSGLIARIPNDTAFILTQAFDVPGWSAVWGVRDVVPGVDEEGTALEEQNWVFINEDTYDDLKIVDFPYCKLTKEGTQFTGYYSADAENWIQIYTVNKSNFAGKELQVGLYSATYTNALGTVLFDDFSLTVEGSASSPIIANSNKVKAFYKANKIEVSSNSTINNLKLYNINGSLISNMNNISSNSYSIPVEKSGVYILVSECGGKSYSQKVIAY